MRGTHCRIFVIYWNYATEWVEHGNYPGKVSSTPFKLNPYLFLLCSHVAVFWWYNDFEHRGGLAQSLSSACHGQPGGYSTSTCACTCVKPVPTFMGMGTVVCGYGSQWVTWVWKPTQVGLTGSFIIYIYAKEIQRWLIYIQWLWMKQIAQNKIGMYDVKEYGKNQDGPCALCVVHCVLCAVYCVLYVVCCALSIVHWVLCAVCCVLCVMHCMLYIVLCVVCCIVYCVTDMNCDTLQNWNVWP